jgi:NAD(P)-dependent dehydrogenase (short-subunit alcohol dehydrogenase family)
MKGLEDKIVLITGAAGGIVTFLASDEANSITGQGIRVSGGLTMHG